MAEFFPSQPDEIWPEGATRASNEPELVLRRCLETALADKPWLVIQNLLVQAPDRVGCREIDFLVVDPERGMIVIEVKGGDYRYTAEHGWYRQVDDEKRIDKAGAVKQCHSAMYHLVKFISTKIFHDPSRPPYLHGWLVALVDAEVQQTSLAPEAQGHVIDAKHCRDPIRLAADIEDLFAALQLNFSNVTCGEDSCMGEIAREILLPTMKTRFAVRDEIRNAQIVESEVMRPVRLIMDAVQDMDRLLVRGYPGTGKTYASLYRASRDLAAGRRTLMLCFNVPLAASLTAQLGARPVRANTAPEEIRARQCVSARIYALAELAARNAEPSIVLPPTESGQDYYDALLDALEKSARAGMFGKFDSIVVDEGQDFSPAMLRALDALAGDCTRIAFLHDPNQALYVSATDEELQRRYGQPLVLRENLRNSATITRFLRSLDPVRFGDLATPPSVRAGQPVVVIEYAHGDTVGQLAAIERIIRHLVDAEGVRHEDIAILSPFTFARSALAGIDSIAGIPLVSVEAAAKRAPDDAPCLRYDTLHRFKGLEAPVVILHDVSGSGKNVAFEAILTACSRAQHALYVLRSSNYAGSTPLPVQGELPL